MIVDPSGIIRESNAAINITFGYAPEELAGRELGVLSPERYRSRHWRYFADYAARLCARPMGERLTLFGRHKDGSEFPVDVLLAPVSAGGRHGLVTIIRDITELKRNEPALTRPLDELVRAHDELESSPMRHLMTCPSLCARPASPYRF